MWSRGILGLLLVTFATAQNIENLDANSFTTTKNVPSTTELSSDQTGLIIVVETGPSLWGSMSLTCTTSGDEVDVVPLTWEPNMARVLVLIQGKSASGMFALSSEETVVYSGFSKEATACGDRDLKSITFTSNATVNWGVCGGEWYCPWIPKTSVPIVPTTEIIFTTDDINVPESTIIPEVATSAVTSKAVTQKVDITTTTTTPVTTKTVVSPTAVPTTITPAITETAVSPTAITTTFTPATTTIVVPPTAAARVAAPNTSNAEVTTSTATNEVPTEPSAITSDDSSSTAETSTLPNECPPVKTQSNSTSSDSLHVPVVVLSVFLSLALIALMTLVVYTFRLRRTYQQLTEHSGKAQDNQIDYPDYATNLWDKFVQEL